MTKRVFTTGILLMTILLLGACGGATPTPTPTEAPPTDTPEPEAVETELADETEATAMPTEAETEAAEAQVATDDVADVATEAPDETEEGDATEAASASTVATLAVADGAMVTISFQNTTARSGPGTDFEVVESLSVGSRLSVVARTESTGVALWYLVRLESGEDAWVWGRVVQLVPADARIEVAATIPAPPES